MPNCFCLVFLPHPFADQVALPNGTARSEGVFWASRHGRHSLSGLGVPNLLEQSQPLLTVWSLSTDPFGIFRTESTPEAVVD
jgi:hypothetical protein